MLKILIICGLLSCIAVERQSLMTCSLVMKFRFEEPIFEEDHGKVFAFFSYDLTRRKQAYIT